MTENPENTIPFYNRLSFRILIIIILVLLAGIGSTIAYYLSSQNKTIIQSRETAIMEESEVLYMTIKNNMLAGEAPLAVDLFRSFERSEVVKALKLYRKNGVPAFSDNSTLKEVNDNLGDVFFTPKTDFMKGETIDNPDFKKSVQNINDVFVRNVDRQPRSIVIYKPLINQPKCSQCHGLDHVVRGVITISSSVDDVYRRTGENLLISAGIYGLVVAVLTVILIIFIHRVIIIKILNIGTVVESVGRGDFKVRVSLKGKDELSSLGSRINTMIKGLNERFKLSKFVSRSTLDHVSGDSDIQLGGERVNMTVLFSDIRGFTSFSENRDPEDVIRILNDVMNLQSEIIAEFDGDIDKFVGDEIMAIFQGEDMVMKAVSAAHKIRNELSARYREMDPSERIYVGIGINTGEMIAGNMGSGTRMDRTVIGDAVNLGSRLCSVAGKNTIVLSEFSYEYVKDRVDVQSHDPIQVKGKAKPVTIYTLRKII